MRTIIGICAALALLAGGYYLLKPGAPALNANNGAAVPIANEMGGATTTGATAAAPTVVVLTDDGFSPARVTVNAGDTVTFVNQSSFGMWIGSDDHATHAAYSGTDRSAHCPDTDGTAFDQCTVGGQYSFTFAQPGTWGFHDHVAAQFTGTVTVTPSP